MFSQLPENLQHTILSLLQQGNFIAAKQVRDKWVHNQNRASKPILEKTA